MGSSRCLSNVVAEDFQEIEVEQGLLAAVRNK
jgi:thiamine pyrophosphokinase